MKTNSSIGLLMLINELAFYCLIDWMLLNVQQQTFPAYSWQEHISNKWWWSRMNPALYKTDRLSRIFNVLAHKNSSLQDDMPLCPDKLFWLLANQSLRFLLKAVCLVEKQQIPILMSSVWPGRGHEDSLCVCIDFNFIISKQNTFCIIILHQFHLE